jgi:hypothetical protein
MGRQLMKYIAFLISGLVLLGSSASAQDAADTATESSAVTDAAPAEPAASEPTAEAAKEEEKKRSPYYKKVQGWLWIEGFLGPTSYDPDQFGSLSLSGVPNAPRAKGPEGGFSVFLGLGGFEIGGFYRQANYTQYKLMKVGLEMQGTFRFIPYVHPIVRIDIGFAKMFQGNPYGLTNTDSGGIALTGGVGVRIPIIRWMSFAATFDWSFVGLSMRGDIPGSTTRFQSWILGQQFGATFALTFHFIGVRGD